MTETPTRREVIEYLLKEIEQGKPYLIVGLDHPEIPTIHNFYPKKYYRTIEHLGFGLFEGSTEHGFFHFDGGGAMHHNHFTDGGWISYTPLRVQNTEVLKDLGYDFEKVAKILKSLL